MKIKEKTKKFIEENETVLIACVLEVVGSVGIFIAGKKIGEYDLTRKLSKKWGVNLFKPNFYCQLKDVLKVKDVITDEVLPDILKEGNLNSFDDEIKAIMLIQKKNNNR